MVDERDSQTDMYDVQLLNVNHQKIIHETTSLEEHKLKLTGDQWLVFDYVEQNIGQQKLMFITGPGGVGKSHLLHTIVHFLELHGEIVQVTATSGSAAKLIYGRTLHSYLGLDSILQTSMKYEDQTWRSLSTAGSLIVDEISIMSAEILERVDEIFRACTNKAGQHKPFGGKNVFLFCNLHQLPTVMTEVTPSQVYNSPLWSKFCPFFLMQNCHQFDPVFREMLERMRTGDAMDDDVLLLES